MANTQLYKFLKIIVTVTSSMEGICYYLTKVLAKNDVAMKRS